METPNPSPLPGDEPEAKLPEHQSKSGTPMPASSPLPQPAPSTDSRSASQQPLPSTETGDSTATMGALSGGIKKKGTAKKAPKRPRKSGPKKAAKKAKPTPVPGASSAAEDNDDGEEDDDDESDHGPYCICRGPDDHRWMICCEKCEDWFHGECIKLSKEIGESLIERFVCPNCTKEGLSTIYKKTCALGTCRKAARLWQDETSVFCSNEHAQVWWERLVSRLPKGKAKNGLNDHLLQDEFMALITSDLSGVDENGLLTLVKMPFQKETTKIQDAKGSTPEEDLSEILTQEEKSILEEAANTRFHLAEDTLLCHKMLTLIELAQERRRKVINAGPFGDDMCGYDPRLDTISARDAFAAFVKSSEGEAIFQASALGEAEWICERKRCKVHGGWQKMLVLGIKHQIREMASQAAEVSEEEKIVRDAAGERWRRKKAECNWVEVLDGA
ncbi:hypothetical protein V2G26_016522 [Clonostachys chloroleuca]|uniref:PHD-type domain-containing protein n=1 Tax=Clonostachys chloroleuca TaxID=1926264 RepID=A0AA35MGM3_9HYPO|nr:unnamed protein product [Clonostachys chloroleuca]